VSWNSGIYQYVVNFFCGSVKVSGRRKPTPGSTIRCNSPRTDCGFHWKDSPKQNQEPRSRPGWTFEFVASVPLYQPAVAIDCIRGYLARIMALLWSRRVDSFARRRVRDRNLPESTNCNSDPSLTEITSRASEPSPQRSRMSESRRGQKLDIGRSNSENRVQCKDPFQNIRNPDEVKRPRLATSPSIL
jgi:hypothetical protein